MKPLRYHIYSLWENVEFSLAQRGWPSYGSPVRNRRTELERLFALIQSQTYIVAKREIN